MILNNLNACTPISVISRSDFQTWFGVALSDQISMPPIMDTPGPKLYRAIDRSGLYTIEIPSATICPFTEMSTVPEQEVTDS